MSATYAIHIDWNADGDFSDTGEDVTTRVLDGSRIVIQSGRDQARAFSPIAPGTCTFELLNTSRDYYPDNTGSPVYPNVKPGRVARVQATLSATTYTLFKGYADDLDVQPNPGERSVALGCVDALTRVAGVKLSTALHPGLRTGAAVELILDAVGWPDADRDIDTGATTIEYWWEEGTDAKEALQKIVASEGSPAMVYVDYSTGYFVFKDRHHRLIDSTSTSSQATFRDTGTEPTFSAPVTYDAGWRDVINSVSFEVNERQSSGSLVDVWTADEVFSIAASGTKVFHIQAGEPFSGAITPVEDTDYFVLAGGLSSVTLSRTSGQSTVITLTAGGSGATIQSLKLRAFSFPVVRTVKVTASDSTSITDHGLQEMPADLEPVWAGRYDAQAIADLLVLQRKQRLPILEITVKGGNDTRLTQQLARDISDRVTVIDAETGLNTAFFIERITHSIGAAAGDHITTFGLEKVPTQPDVFILGTSLLDTGKLGY
ncbi:MAG TPA: hypothetical protein VIV12_08695 [Streptosporangiaceae bacterium]